MKKQTRVGIRPNGRIFSHADSFREAAILCRKNDLFQPMAVNAALAVELYLKSLLAVDIVSEEDNSKYTISGFTSEHGHDFLQLIDKIEKRDKQLFFAQLADIDSSINWEKEFKKFDGIFIKVRYWYETKNWVPIDSVIVDFAENIREAILRVAKIKEGC